MFWILLIVVFFICLFFPFVRYGFFHPVLSLRHGISDVRDYLRRRRYNECKEYGHIRMFTASDSQAFGSGKTLSMVRTVRAIYNQYNNKLVWDDEKQEFVTQRIIIISNLEFKDIPYIKFIGKDQFINLDKLEHTEHDIILFVLDEAGMVFNSREYKNNMSTDFLARLLQVRHNKVGFFMTAQRFGFVDKILRQTTEVVTTCKKKWRIVRLQDFDAYALENCPNPTMIMPYSTRWYFAKDSLYNSYDTTYNVEQLKEQLESGDLLSTEEMIANLGGTSGPDVVKNKLRGAYRRRK